MLAPAVFSQAILTPTGWNVLTEGAYNSQNNNSIQVGVGTIFNLTGSNGARTDIVANQTVFTFKLTGTGGEATFTTVLDELLQSGNVLEFYDAALTSACCSGSYQAIELITYTNP